MKSQLAKLYASEGFRQSVITIGGNLSAVSLSAIAMMLISRSLGPTLYGEFSVGFSIVLISSRIIDLGLVPTMQRFIPQEKIDSQNRIFSFIMRTKIMMFLGIAALGIIATPWLNGALHLQFSYIIPLAFILSSATVFYEQIAGMLQSLHSFGKAVSANILHSGAKFITVLLMFATGSTTIIPAFIVYMGAPAIGALAGLFLLPKSVHLNLRQSFTKERKMIQKMAGHAAIGFIAAGFIEHVDVLFVQKFLTSYETGLLAGASRIALLVLMAAYSLGAVLNPRVSRYTDSKHLRSYWKKAVIISGIALISFVAWIPFNKLAILLTIGPEYLPSADILLILMASSVLAFASIPMIAVFFAVPKAEWYFSVAGIAQLFVIIFGNWLFVPDFGLEATAWTRFASKLLLFIFSAGLAYYFVKKHNPTPFYAPNTHFQS